MVWRDFKGFSLRCPFLDPFETHLLPYHIHLLCAGCLIFMGCLIFIGHFPRKSPIFCGSVANAHEDETHLLGVGDSMSHTSVRDSPPREWAVFAYIFRSALG